VPPDWAEQPPFSAEPVSHERVRVPFVAREIEYTTAPASRLAVILTS
jgi:hypothetical protein